MNDSPQEYDKIAAANLKRSNDASDQHDAAKHDAENPDPKGYDQVPAAKPSRRKNSAEKYYAREYDPQNYDKVAATNLSRNKASGQSPGEIMREARLANDYTVEDLCAQTKLSRKAVHALEDNDFEALSQPVFARGYYRQCAKVLDIDSDRLMAAYAAWGGESAPRATAPSAVHVVPEDVTPPRWRAVSLIAGLLVVLVAIGAVVALMPSAEQANDNDGNNTIVLSNTDNQSPPQAGTRSDEAAVDAGQGRNQNGDQNNNQNSNGGADGFDGNGNGADRSMNAQANGERNTNAGTDAATTGADQAGGVSGQRSGGLNVNDALGRNDEGRNADGAANAGPPAEPAIAANHLSVTFSNRSWIDVRDADGKRLLTGIYEAGEKREFDATPPYKITLGRAIAVDIGIGGKKVDIASQTASNGTARLTVKARGG